MELGFSGGLGWDPAAYPVSDRPGRYLFCNALGTTTAGLGVYSSKAGYRLFYGYFGLSVPPTLDVELVPE